MAIKRLKKAIAAHLAKQGIDTLVALLKADEIGNIIETCQESAGVRLVVDEEPKRKKAVNE